MSEEHQPEPIHDPPIEHDDLGQALLTLPFAVGRWPPKTWIVRVRF